MAWLTENWIWVLFGVAFIAMHMFGHGGHGGRGGGCGHGSHGSGVGGNVDPKKTDDEHAKSNSPSATGGNRKTHRH